MTKHAQKLTNRATGPCACPLQVASGIEKIDRPLWKIGTAVEAFGVKLGVRGQLSDALDVFPDGLPSQPPEQIRQRDDMPFPIKIKARDSFRFADIPPVLGHACPCLSPEVTVPLLRTR